jgi:hypothetical protein
VRDERGISVVSLANEQDLRGTKLALLWRATADCAAGGIPPRSRLECYGVTGCVPQSPLNSARSGVYVTWKRPLPFAFTV